MKGLTIANGGDKSKRRKLDFYPTPVRDTTAKYEGCWLIRSERY